MRAGPEDGSVELTRDMGFWDITLIGVGAMIGAGIFVLIGSAAGVAGPALILAFVLNGLLKMLTCMVYAELGSALPSAGGSYVFIRHALPGAFPFMAGWMSWFGHAVAGSLYALGFGSFTVEILRIGGWNLRAMAESAGLWAHAPEIGLGILIALVFFYINYRGARETGTAGAIVTVAKIVAILIFAGGGFWILMQNPERLSRFQPFAPEGFEGVLLAMGITYVAFEGFEVIVQAGEEVKDPKRNVPRAVVTALVIVVPTYLLVSIALLGAIDPPAGEPSTWQWLGTIKELGLARAADQVVPYGTMVVLVGGLLSTMSALNATTFSSTRVSFAMGRDGYLPDFFSKIHPETRTPHVALGISGILILFMLVALPLESVAASASLMFLLLFLMVNFSSIFLRSRYGDRLAFGFLTPFFPAVPVLAIVIQVVLAGYLLHFGTDVLVTAVVWLGGGAAVYTWYSRERIRERPPAPVVLEERAVLEEGYEEPPVVLPVARPQSAGSLVRAASAIARTQDRHVLLLHVITVPEQLPITAGNELVDEARDEMRGVLEQLRETGVEAELLIRLSHRPASAILRTLEASEADFCVLGWRGTSRGRNRVLGSNLDEILKEANCNFVVMQEFPEKVDRILMPASNPEQAEVFFAVGYAIARGVGAEEIDVVTVFDPDTDDATVDARTTEMAEVLSEVALSGTVERPLERWAEAVRVDGVRVTFQAERASDTLGHLVERSRGYDLMVVGAGPGGPWGRDVLGRFTWALSRHPACPVVAVKRRAGALHFQLQSFFEFFREEDAAAREVGDGLNGEADGGAAGGSDFEDDIGEET